MVCSCRCVGEEDVSMRVRVHTLFPNIAAELIQNFPPDWTSLPVENSILQNHSCMHRSLGLGTTSQPNCVKPAKESEYTNLQTRKYESYLAARQRPGFRCRAAETCAGRWDFKVEMCTIAAVALGPLTYFTLRPVRARPEARSAHIPIASCNPEVFRR